MRNFWSSSFYINKNMYKYYFSSFFLRSENRLFHSTEEFPNLFNFKPQVIILGNFNSEKKVHLVSTTNPTVSLLGTSRDPLINQPLTTVSHTHKIRHYSYGHIHHYLSNGYLVAQIQQSSMEGTCLILKFP